MENYSDETRYNWWESDGWWESEDKVEEDMEATEAAAATAFMEATAASNNAHPADAQLGYGIISSTRKRKGKSFGKRLDDLLFTYVTVFTESWAFSGVLVGVFIDFLVLVKGCSIIEIPLREVEAVKFLALGCPETRKGCKHSDKGKKHLYKGKKHLEKRNVIVKNRLDTTTILRNLFSENRKR